jgi:hypothetical protein
VVERPQVLRPPTRTSSPSISTTISECPSKRAAVSPPIEAVLAVALAKSPDRRFATAGELATAFRAAAAGALDQAIVERADAVLADLPWDTWSKR